LSGVLRGCEVNGAIMRRRAGYARAAWLDHACKLHHWIQVSTTADDDTRARWCREAWRYERASIRAARIEAGVTK
jgi:hypothetical protein